MIYLVRAGGKRYKIGYTKDLDARLKALRAQYPTTEVRLMASGPGEPEDAAALRAHFRPAGQRKQLWFGMPKPRVNQAVRLIIAGQTPTSQRASNARHYVQREERKRQTARATARSSGLVPRDGRPRASKVKVYRVEPD